MAEIISIAWWQSRPVRRLHLLAAAVIALVLFRVGWEEDLTWIGWVIAAITIVILTSVRWPYGALFVVVAMSVMPVYFVEILGWNARPEHFAVAFVSVATALWFSFSKRPIPFDKTDGWLMAFVIINFISSAVGSSAPASTLRWALQNSLAVIPYFLIRLLVQDLETLRKAFRMFLAVGLAESTFGILCYISYHLFGTKIGMSTGQYLASVSAPYGSMYEPNLFGAYSGCCAVMFLAMYLLGRDKIYASIGFLITAWAAVLSYSRAALAAFIAAGIWVSWKSRHPTAGRRNAIAPAAVVLALVIVVILTPVGDVLKERFENLYYEGLTEETAISRVLVTQEALMDIPSHPLLGSGTASFNLSFDWTRFIPQWASDKTWIGNAPLRILHDTGLIGLTAFLGFFASIWWKVRRTWKRPLHPDSMIFSLASGVLVYAVSFQFTDGTILAFFWIHLGLLASAGILGIRGSSPLSSRITTELEL